jgi:putative transcriptional regulator
MTKKIKEALGDILQGSIDAGVKIPFNARDLKVYGVEIKRVKVDPWKIKQVRKRTHLSQAVFAKVLNVSLSSVRQWEQGTRTPTGSTKVLLNLLSKQPDLVEQLIY